MTQEIHPEAVLMPQAVQEVAPQLEERDVANDHQEKALRRRDEELMSWAESLGPDVTDVPRGTPDGEQEGQERQGRQEGQEGEESPGFLSNLGQGFAGLPRNAVGGAVEGIEQTFRSIRDVTEPLDRFLMEDIGIPGVIRHGPDDFELTTDFDKMRAAGEFGDLFPDIGDRGIVKGLSQFLTGFVGAGRVFKNVAALRKLGQGGMTAQASLAALKGAVSDFASFDEMDNAVSGLVEAFPALDPVLPDFLEADEDDPAVVNRLRNTLTGLGFGVATDTVMGGLRLLRSGRFARKQIGQGVDVLEQAEQVATDQKALLTEALGDPDNPSLLVNEAGDAVFTTPKEGVLFHGSGSSHASLKPGSMLTGSPDEAAGFAVNFENLFDESLTGKVHEVSFEPARPLVVEGSLRKDAEGELIKRAGSILKREPSSLEEAARVVHSAQGFDAIVASDGGIISLVDVPSSRIFDPADVVRSSLRAGREVPSNIKEAFDRLSSPGGEPGGTFVNWSRIDSSDDVRQVIQEMADSFSDNIDEARRGVMSFADTEEAAANENAWRLLLERGPGQTLNAEQSLAARQLWTSSGSKVKQLARQATASKSDIDQIALRKMIAIHSTIQEQVIAARTETARALSSWRIPAGDSPQFLGGMEVLMSQIDAERSTLKLAEAITTLDTMGQTAAADAFVYSAGRLSTLGRYASNASDMVRQLYYASLLSGPHTHARNAISNTGMLGLNVVERKGANLLGRALGDQNVPDGEAMALLHGQIQGFREAFRVSAHARKTALAEGQRFVTGVDRARALASGDLPTVFRGAEPVERLSNLARGRLGRAFGAGSEARAAREAVEATGGVGRSPIGESLATGSSGHGVGKVDSRAVGAFSSEKLRLDPESTVGRVFDWIDTATSLPTRGLGAADEVFKTSNFRAEIHARAFRQATKEMDAGTIQPDEFVDRLATLTNNPDEAIRLHALNMAEESTFTDRPENTEFWQAMRGISRVPVFGKIVLPFSRTPYNLAIQSFQRLPFAPLTKKWRNDILAGGARGDIAWSKFLAGNAALAVMADLAMRGVITGENKGLSDGSGKLQTLRRLGAKSMVWNIQFDENEAPRTFSFRGLEPFSTTIGLAATATEILQSEDFEDEDNDALDVTVAASLAIASQLTSANYMSGFSAMIEALSDPVRYGEGYFERLLTPIVPTGIAQVARFNDPLIREVTDYLDAVKARTPGTSTSLEPKLDVWGREISRESGLGGLYDFMSPIYSGKADQEPIDLFLNENEAWMGKPSKRVSFDGVTVNLKNKPALYNRYVKLAGNELTETQFGSPIVVGAIGYVSEGGGLKDELNAIVQGKHSFSSIFDLGTDGPDGDKAAFIRSIVNEYRKHARTQMLEESPELRAEVQSRADEKPKRNFGQRRRMSLNLLGGR